MVGYHAVPVCSCIPAFNAWFWLGDCIEFGDTCLLLCSVKRVSNCHVVGPYALPYLAGIYVGGPSTHVRQVLLCSGHVQGLQASIFIIQGAIGQASRQA